MTVGIYVRPKHIKGLSPYYNGIILEARIEFPIFNNHIPPDCERLYSKFSFYSMGLITS